MELKGEPGNIDLKNAKMSISYDSIGQGNLLITFHRLKRDFQCHWVLFLIAQLCTNSLLLLRMMHLSFAKRKKYSSWPENLLLNQTNYSVHEGLSQVSTNFNCSSGNTFKELT